MPRWYEYTNVWIVNSKLDANVMSYHIHICCSTRIPRKIVSRLVTWTHREWHDQIQLSFRWVEDSRSHNGIRIRLYNKHHMQEAASSFAGSWAPRASTVSEISRKCGHSRLWIHFEWKWDTECPTLASLTIGLRWFPLSRHRLHRVTDAVCAQRTLEYCYRQLPTPPSYP